MNEQEFWAALQPIEPKPILYRLYYDNAGNPLYFSQEDLPGNYIDIDHATYINPPTHMRVIDKKLVIVNNVIITKLYSNGVGTPCHPQDVAVVVSELSNHIKWSLK